MSDPSELARLALALGPRLAAQDAAPREPYGVTLDRILGEGRSCHAWGGTTSRTAVLDEMLRITDQLEQISARILFFEDEEYPASLRRCPAPPRALFVAGRIPPIQWVALVGSRAASIKYVELTHQLAAALGRAGWGVVSGGALGIDGAAHLGALEVNCPTAVFLGSGLDQLYPPRHRELFARIQASGALISPFPPGAPPRRAHFLQRNALIASMARGVVVVEAQLRSGALNTARHAREMGIPVMAVDTSPGAKLLLQRGAARVENADNILNVIEGGSGAPPRNAENPDQCAVLEALAGAPLSLDQIAQVLEWRPSRAAGVLLTMELLGLVHAEPGGRFRGGLP